MKLIITIFRNGHPKKIHTVRLLKSFNYSITRKATSDDIDEDEDCTDPFIPTEKLSYETPMLKTVCDLVRANDKTGISLLPMARFFNLSRLDVRLICRVLQKNNAVEPVLSDRGRQRLQL